jgi:hypothetical protein
MQVRMMNFPFFNQNQSLRMGALLDPYQRANGSLQRYKAMTLPDTVPIQNDTDKNQPNAISRWLLEWLDPLDFVKDRTVIAVKPLAAYLISKNFLTPSTQSSENKVARAFSNVCRNKSDKYFIIRLKEGNVLCVRASSVAQDQALCDVKIKEAMQKPPFIEALARRLREDPDFLYKLVGSQK